jgi:putative heme-binding domain-containing protein
LAALDNRSAVEAALRALDKPVDQFLDFALWLTARETERHWLPVLQHAEKSSDMGFDGDARRQTFALLAIGSAPTVRPLTVLLREGNIPAESQENALATIGSQGGPRDLALVLDVALDEESMPPARRAKLLESLAGATRQRKIGPDGDVARLDVLLSGSTTDESLRTAAARVAGLWQVQPLKPSLIALAQADDTSDSVRQAALEGLVSFGDVTSREAVVDLCRPPHTTSVRVAALAALASLDPFVAATRAPDVLQDCGSDADAAAVFRGFLERKDGPKTLAEALAGRALPRDVAKLGVRLSSISGREHPELVAALTKAGGVTGGAEPLTPDELRQMVHEVLERGDPARGEEVFRRQDGYCFKCHAIAGAGGLVGPDLLSIGASAPVDYLIESLFDPNKAVKEGYHSVVVATSDGRVLTGIKVRQTGSELVLRNAEDREIAVPLNSIEEQKPGGSLMPAGLTEPLTRGELIDLVRFLSELGKVGPFAVSKARVARRWEVLQMTPEAAQQIRHAGLDTVVNAESRFRWSSVFSKVSGELPPDVLQSVKIPYQSSPSVGFVRVQLDVATPGKVQIALHSADGLKLWLDSSATKAETELILDLSKGRHTLTFAIDLDQRSAGLRCELQDVAGSEAQVQFAAGN